MLFAQFRTSFAHHLTQVEKNLLGLVTISMIAVAACGTIAVAAHGTKSITQKENELKNTQVVYKEADYENIAQVMLADIAYCDDKILVFKDYFGLFVYSFDEKRIVSSLNVGYIGCNMNQGDNACTFNSYNNGEIIELNNQENKYWFDWKKNELYSSYDLEEKTLDSRDNLSENTDWESYYSSEKVDLNKGTLRLEVEETDYDYKTVIYTIENNGEIVESNAIFMGDLKWYFSEA